MGFNVSNLESIDPAHIAKLQEAGVEDMDEVLRQAGGKDARAAFAARTGLPDLVLVRLVRMADLMRIAGVNEAHTQLLEALGVETASGLAARDAAVLVKELRRKNVELTLVRVIPPESTIARWVFAARTLPVVAHV